MKSSARQEERQLSDVNWPRRLAAFRSCALAIRSCALGLWRVIISSDKSAAISHVRKFAAPPGLGA